MKRFLKHAVLLTVGAMIGFAACIHLYNIVEEEVHTEEFDDDDFDVTDV